MTSNVAPPASSADFMCVRSAPENPSATRMPTLRPLIDFGWFAWLSAGDLSTGGLASLPAAAGGVSSDLVTPMPAATS
jgi:hypothetical protein